MNDFESLEIGRVLAVGQLSVERSLLGYWGAVYSSPAEQTVVPIGVVSALMMRAYCELFGDRPKGNIHVGQQLEVHRVPEIDEPLDVTVSCGDKKMSRDRRIVRIDVTMTSNNRGDPIANSSSTLFWAA